MRRCAEAGCELVAVFRRERCPDHLQVATAGRTKPATSSLATVIGKDKRQSGVAPVDYSDGPGSLFDALRGMPRSASLLLLCLYAGILIFSLVVTTDRMWWLRLGGGAGLGAALFALVCACTPAPVLSPCADLWCRTRMKAQMLWRMLSVTDLRTKIPVTMREAGLMPDRVTQFYDAVKKAYAGASYRDRLLDDERFDALYGSVDANLYQSCRGLYRGLRGFPREYSEYLGMDIGRSLGASEKKMTALLINEHARPAKIYDGDLLGALKSLKEKMEADGLEPTIFAVAWNPHMRVHDWMWRTYIPNFQPNDKIFSRFFADHVQGLPVVREEGLRPERIYCIDLKAFCKIRFDLDSNLMFEWYRHSGLGDDEIVFAAYSPCNITLKDPAAARYIDAKDWLPPIEGENETEPQ